MLFCLLHLQVDERLPHGTWMCTRAVPVPLVKEKSSTVGVHSSHVVVLIPVRPLAASSQAITNGWNQKIYQDLVRVR